ncbi:hypothetical protein CCMA1212_005125 [Trichoderma ghanense]|uniref:HNH nuclease domain-containing protein n=1 Tax=Trichoderma ghanense TaxID=65468 RepID=A0ABY2H3I4_9HYPO
MAYSLTVAALLHPWSGRLEIICNLPVYRDKSTTFDIIPLRFDNYPGPVQKHKRRQRRLSIELPRLLNHQRDDTKDEVLEEEDTIRLFPSNWFSLRGLWLMRASSTTETQSDTLSSDETTCEDLDTTSETLETTATDSGTLQEETLDALVHLTISETAKAEEKPEAEGEPETPFILPLARKLSPSPEYRNEYFQVAKSRVAGWGAFATRDLKLGDIILREIPLFVAESHNIIREFYKLSLQDREVALSLHAHELIKGDTPRITAVWHTNWQVSLPRLQLVRLNERRLTLHG